MKIVSEDKVESASGKLLNSQRLDWVEIMKTIALVWIFLNHVVERMFGYPYIGNPSADWPPLSERLTQLQPLQGSGFWDIPLNIVRYVGWFGDQGVQIFLVLSGFALTWGLLTRYGKAPIPIWDLYQRRAERIYPLWWAAHLLFVVSWILIGRGLSVTDPALYLSMIGVRFTPGLFYYFSPAWWYIGLLLQLYLIYPLLWSGLRRLGPGRLLLWSCIIGFGVRAVGLLLFKGYLDPWQRGAIFITRLPEFVFGISLASYVYSSPRETAERLRSPITVFVALLVWALGIALSITLLGMTVALFLESIGAFVIFYALVRQAERLAPRNFLLPWVWAGRHSYSLYLLHHPFILFLLPLGLVGLPQVLLRCLAAVVLTVVGALALEQVVILVRKAVIHCSHAG